MGSHRSSRRAAGALRKTALSTLEENARDEPAGSPPDQPRTQDSGKTTVQLPRRPAALLAARLLLCCTASHAPDKAATVSPAPLQRGKSSTRLACARRSPTKQGFASWKVHPKLDLRRLDACRENPDSAPLLKGTAVERLLDLAMAAFAQGRPEEAEGRARFARAHAAHRNWPSSQPHEVARLIEWTGDPVAAPSDGMIAQDRRAMARAGSFERRRATESPGDSRPMVGREVAATTGGASLRCPLAELGFRPPARHGRRGQLRDRPAPRCRGHRRAVERIGWPNREDPARAGGHLRGKRAQVGTRR
jgi:hypothetical protein